MRLHIAHPYLSSHGPPMNSSDIHERRRAAAAVLKQKFGHSHGVLNHRAHLLQPGHENDDESEYIDSVSQRHQHPTQAAPANRVVRHVPISLAPVTASSQPKTHEQRVRVPSAAVDDRGRQSGVESPGGCLPEQQKAHVTNQSGWRRPLKPVVEGAEFGGAVGNRLATPNPPARSHRAPRRLTRAGHEKKSSSDEGRAQKPQHQRVEQLVDEVKRRLSLPSDTSIPDSFLVKHKERLNEFSLRPEAPISRRDRRQSLAEIGFGRSSSYNKLHVLGAGTYSIVYKGASRLTSRLVALKEIHLERDEGVPFTAIREVSLLKQLKHCNIITLHDIIYTSRTLTLVFEYVDRDLSRYMDECDHKIEPRNVKLFLFQLLRALAHCHARKILHRDIKPQNILISMSGELKLADFGLARAKSFPTKTYTDEVVTLWYRPPDVLLGNTNYGPCIDTWGVGCIFFEMLAGFTLFLATDPVKQIGCIFDILGTPNERSWPNIEATLKCNEIDIGTERTEGRGLVTLAPQLESCADATNLLEQLLVCNPKQRISSARALRHEYFSSLPRKIYDLHDSASIFSLEGVELSPEPHMRRHSNTSRPLPPPPPHQSNSKFDNKGR